MYSKSRNKDVLDLKKRIKAEKSNQFSDVDADQLTLWRVSIAVASIDKRKPVVLNEHDTAIELDPTDDISDVFKVTPPKKTIHIIVQRPPPASAQVSARIPTPHSVYPRDASRSSFPIPTIFIPQEKIEAELTDILRGVSYNHTTRTADPKEVETSQREKLGRFYKRPLPYHETAENISLVMLGLELDKQAKTSEGETLREIVDKDVGRSSDLRVVAMVAPSGSGKTATVIDLASKHFVIYTVCCIPGPSISLGFQDPNFLQLSTDVESIYRDVIQRNQGSLLDAVDNDSEVKALIGDRVKIRDLNGSDLTGLSLNP
ncbi:hypothetical protein BGX20_002369, partial [Mortierella sp. AD010]